MEHCSLCAFKICIMLHWSETLWNIYETVLDDTRVGIEKVGREGSRGVEP